MRDVLMLAQNDWANTGWRFSKCLERLGLDVKAFKGNSHKFGYPVQLPILSELQGLPNGALAHDVPKLHNMAKEAKVIHFITSTVIYPGVNLLKKNVVMQHGGSIFRQNSQRVNGVVNKIADACIIQCPDLLGLGAKNEHLIYYPVDTDFLRPYYKRMDQKRLIIGHFPSNPITKGTSTILKVISELESNPAFSRRFKYVGIREDGSEGLEKWNTGGSLLTWDQHLARVAACDIIIECCQPYQRGVRYGEWGNAAIEGAALGKIVITNTHNEDVYLKEYKCSIWEGLHIANSKSALMQTLIEMLDCTDLQIAGYKRDARDWVEHNHSIDATANRLWEKIYKHFF